MPIANNEETEPQGKTWEEVVGGIDWGDLAQKGQLPENTTLRVVATEPREFDIADILGLLKFGMN